MKGRTCWIAAVVSASRCGGPIDPHGAGRRDRSWLPGRRVVRALNGLIGARGKPAVSDNGTGLTCRAILKGVEENGVKWKQHRAARGSIRRLFVRRSVAHLSVTCYAPSVATTPVATTPKKSKPRTPPGSAWRRARLRAQGLRPLRATNSPRAFRQSSFCPVSSDVQDGLRSDRRAKLRRRTVFAFDRKP
jgi:hypothetical protein